MAQLLPTTKQLSYLLTLGYAGPMPATRHAASSLIATLEARRRAMRNSSLTNSRQDLAGRQRQTPARPRHLGSLRP